MHYARIVQAIFESAWAIQPAKLEAIVEFIHLKASGQPVPEIQAASGSEPTLIGSVAVIPVRGTLVQRANLMSDFSGGASVQRLTAQFRNALSDDSVSAILFDIDSPGGSVYGIQELADEIYSAREKKPIFAIANSLAASAAYWLGSAASEFVVTPSGDVGSIGVIMAHTDQSRLDDALGVKVTYIHAGQYKAEGNPHEPLSDDAATFYQQRVDEYMDEFVSAVARYRGTTASDVRSNYGQGRVYGARQAQTLGMVDRIETFDHTLRRLQAQRKTPHLTSARNSLKRLSLGRANPGD